MELPHFISLSRVIHGGPVLERAAEHLVVLHQALGGAGLYVDGAVGAAGSTGRGEANLYNLCSFLIVEEMRRGRHPKDAGMEALNRIKANTIEKRLLNSKGNPNFGINFYILNAKGEFAGLTMYPGPQFAVCNDSGPRTLSCDALLSGKPND